MGTPLGRVVQEIFKKAGKETLPLLSGSAKNQAKRPHKGGKWLIKGAPAAGEKTRER